MKHESPNVGTVRLIQMVSFRKLEQRHCAVVVHTRGRAKVVYSGKALIMLQHQRCQDGCRFTPLYAVVHCIAHTLHGLGVRLARQLKAPDATGPQRSDPRSDRAYGERERRVVPFGAVDGDQNLEEPPRRFQMAAHADVMLEEEGHGGIGFGQRTWAMQTNPALNN